MDSDDRQAAAANLRDVLVEIAPTAFIVAVWVAGALWLAVPEEFSERENRLIEYFGRTMHVLTCGDWNAAGFETKQSFRVAAGFAVVALNQEGLDLLDILPKEARGHRD